MAEGPQPPKPPLQGVQRGRAMENQEAGFLPRHSLCFQNKAPNLPLNVLGILKMNVIAFFEMPMGHSCCQISSVMNAGG